jgi:hypothetical protein
MQDVHTRLIWVGLFFCLSAAWSMSFIPELFFLFICRVTACASGLSRGKGIGFRGACDLSVYLSGVIFTTISSRVFTWVYVNSNIKHFYLSIFMLLNVNGEFLSHPYFWTNISVFSVFRKNLQSPLLQRPTLALLVHSS